MERSAKNPVNLDFVRPSFADPKREVHIFSRDIAAGLELRPIRSHVHPIIPRLDNGRFGYRSWLVFWRLYLGAVASGSGEIKESAAKHQNGNRAMPA